MTSGALSGILTPVKMISEIVELLVERVLFEAPVRRSMDIPLPPDLLQIGQMFKADGKQFYLVGGSVRDALLGKDPKDFDLATDAVPDDIELILRQNPRYRVLEVGKAFGVVKVITDQGNEYEIATFRQDIGKGRRPDAVAFTSIDQDVARRDLTMNALFYDIENREIVDFVGGIQDIEQGIVRTVGNPHERFDEDRLRILRALRFAARMGSGLDPATAAAIKANNSLVGVSGERIRDEFIKGIKSAKSVPQFLHLISEYDLWDQVFPGLKVNRNFINSKNVPVQLAALLRDNEYKSLPGKLNNIKYPADEATAVQFLVMFQGLSVELAFRFKRLFKNSRLSNAELIDFAKAVGRPSEQLVHAFIRFEPSVTGAELQAQGYQGQELGKEMDRRETEIFKRLM